LLLAIIVCDVSLQVLLYLIIVGILREHLVVRLFILVCQEDLVVSLLWMVTHRIMGFMGSCERGSSEVFSGEDVRRGKSLISNASFIAVFPCDYLMLSKHHPSLVHILLLLVVPTSASSVGVMSHKGQVASAAHLLLSLKHLLIVIIASA
jgi:hypothetical protein